MILVIILFQFMLGDFDLFFDKGVLGDYDKDQGKDEKS
jgi:hypothetical protein